MTTHIINNFYRLTWRNIRVSNDGKTQRKRTSIDSVETVESDINLIRWVFAPLLSLGTHRSLLRDKISIFMSMCVIKFPFLVENIIEDFLVQNKRASCSENRKKTEFAWSKICSSLLFFVKEEYLQLRLVFVIRVHEQFVWFQPRH